MGDTELRHLRTLVAIAEEGTFGKAASRLGYTQSSVSQHIAVLEKAVGGPVFDRPGGPKPVRLTPLGAVVIEHGRELLSHADALDDAVDRFKAGDGRIDIGTLPSISNVILPTVVRRLQDEHPNCEIRLSEEAPGQEQLGELDLLFYDAPIGDDAEHVLLTDDPYLVVARPGDLPAGKLPLAALDGKGVVAWPAAYGQPRLEEALAAAGAQLRVVFRTPGNDTILSMVRAGMGSAVLPWLAIRHLACPECGDIHGSDGGADQPLRVHELDPSPKREIYLHWPRGHTARSPLAAHAIEIAVEAARALAQPAPHRKASH
ncbi:LysR family transcriptional regulator [Kribbella deserti]|uniref:LysR family transcriptional regulator n=1 Tax=Kribbella deserti TaxID=1926257 RepID=A0ABV6QV80_9ACTN